MAKEVIYNRFGGQIQPRCVFFRVRGWQGRKSNEIQQCGGCGHRQIQRVITGIQWEILSQFGCMAHRQRWNNQHTRTNTIEWCDGGWWGWFTILIKRGWKIHPHFFHLKTNNNATKNKSINRTNRIGTIKIEHVANRSFYYDTRGVGYWNHAVNSKHQTPIVDGFHVHHGGQRVDFQIGDM